MAIKRGPGQGRRGRGDEREAVCMIERIGALVRFACEAGPGEEAAVDEIVRGVLRAIHTDQERGGTSVVQ